MKAIFDQFTTVAIFLYPPGRGRGVRGGNAPVFDATRGKRLVDLGSPHFVVREKAAEALARVADQSLPRLRSVLDTESSAGVRERVSKLLATADRDTPESRLAIQAVEVLEMIGSPDAKAGVTILAQGAAGARLTEVVSRVLGRMN